ncbi:MAG: hypothetical protein FJW34_12560 [Acidobacteria bacterium]|nr:hypothetical protein [Acidobacteriota bacterium]
MEQLALGLMIAGRELSAQVRGMLSELPSRVVTELPDFASAAGELLDSEVRRSNPDLVFLETAAAGERFPALVGLIKNRPSPPAVITIHGEADTEKLLTAIRSGASDCLYLPLEEATLRATVDRVMALRERSRPRRPPAKTVGFLSATGGCGGTMVACHFASELRRLSGQNILLADFDVAAGMVGFWMRTANGYSIRDAARSLMRLDLSLWRGLVATVQPRLDVVSAPAEIVPEGACSPEDLLKVARFARSHYDWMVADLGAGLTASSLPLLSEMEALYLVSTAEVAALYQARRVLLKLMTIDYPPERVRVILNRLHKQQQIRPSDVEKSLDRPIEAVLPYDLREIEDAQGEGRLISPGSELGKRIAELARGMAGKQPEEKSGFWNSLFRPS